jgi:RND superfamily putative drug exporter
VFQHTWAEKTLDFTSSGTVTDWVPITAFVILFGLSMDYTILVLERIREARRAGLDPRAAATEGVAKTARTVTSAALVMVAIFATFVTLPLIELKMLGITLAAGVLIDATIVRGIALPAVVTLLGERGMRAPRRATRRAGLQVAPDVR